MIIPNSFKLIYDKYYQELDDFKKDVDSIISSIKEKEGGFTFTSRVKDLEGMFIKASLGEYLDPFTEIIDFFACEITVPTLSEIPRITTLIEETFEIVSKKKRTIKPQEFPYSDLHLVLNMKRSRLMRNTSITQRKFELQIKTLLQEAWWRVDHDIVYKGHDISWGRERMSGQLRALLDLADGVLAQLEDVSKLLHHQAEDANPDYKSDEKVIISTMEKYWKASDLPKDQKRMATIIQKYIKIANINVSDFQNILQKANESNDEIFSKNSINSMQKLFIILFKERSTIIKAAIEKGEHNMLITEEMLDPCPELRELKNGVIFIEQ